MPKAADAKRWQARALGAHVRMFRFFGAAPRLLVPDNLKSAVNKPSFHDPEVNRTYAAMATHYNVGVLPARPRKPKDKAAVEAGSASPSPTSSGGCVTSPSSHWPHATPRSPWPWSG